jgi:hypothetical protein
MEDDMSDIAKELRDRSLRAEQEGEQLALLDEAADEIERLRLADEERAAIDRLCRAVARHSALQRIRGLKDHFADEDEQAYSIVRGWLARLT